MPGALFFWDIYKIRSCCWCAYRDYYRDAYYRDPYGYGGYSGYDSRGGSYDRR